MGQKGHIMVQKGLKMHEKRQKMEVFDLKYLLFTGIFLSGKGGYTLPSLNGGGGGHKIVQKGLKMHEKRQKIEFLDLKNLLFSGIFLSGIGGYPPPLNGKSV